MPAQIHPYLQPKEEEVTPAVEPEALEGAEGTAPEPEIPEAPVTETPPETPPPPARVIDLDSPTLYRDLEKWQQEDPAFRNRLNSLVGRKAKLEYQPQIAQLQAELARKDQRLRELEVKGLDEDEIKDRLLKDPSFRQTYGQAPQVTPEAIQLKAQMEAALARAEEPVLGYLDDDVLDRFRNAVATGWFDHDRDARGNPVRARSPQEALIEYGNALRMEAQRQAQAKATPPPPPPPPPPVQAAAVTEEPKPAAKPNTRLAQLSPDLSNSSAPQTGAPRMPLSEWHRLNPMQRKAIAPELSDYERLRKEQVIYDD